MSLRARVVLIVMALAAAAAVAAFAAVVLSARSAVRAETMAALDAAELAVKGLARAGAAGGPADLAALIGPRDLRHVRVTLPDSRASVPTSRVVDEAAPRWFADLVWTEPVNRSVALPGGTAILEADPRDELKEAWTDAVTLAWIAAGTLLLLLAAVHLAVTRALAPLTGFSRALEALSRGEREVPTGLPPTGRTVPELAAIGRRIHDLDSALEQAQAENAALARTLMDIQDRERRDLAREVHDELGPLLFGIRVDAHAVSRAAAGHHDDPAIRARADSIAEAAGRIRDISRRILGRLRPVALDHLPLADVLMDLVDGLQLRHSGVTLTLTTTSGLGPMGEAIDLTIYRVVQEGVLNALRHGRASSVEVRVEMEQDDLVVTVRDDGTGLADGTAPGHGIAGMRERVRILGGCLTLASHEGGGAELRAIIPLPRERMEAPA